MEVVIVVGRCARTGDPFGIRFEEREPGDWVFDWAFAIKEQAAQREGYDRTTVRGVFTRGEHYPGCPHCGSRGIYLCSCGKVNCWDLERKQVTCAWCGSTGILAGTIEALTGTTTM